MKILGFVFGAILILTMLFGASFAEHADQAKKKLAIKKDIKEIKNPNEDRSVRITSIKKPSAFSPIHVVGVEVCAGRERLYSPELDLKSDRESITVQVSGLIMPKTCKSGEFFIRATNPDTISVSFSKPIYYVRLY